MAEFTEEQIGAIVQKKLQEAIKNGGMEQTQTFIVPSGTVADTVTRIEFVLDARFKRCDGIALYQIKAQSNLNYRVGFATGNTTIQERVSAKHLIADERTPQNSRFKKIEMRAAGQKHYVEIENKALLSSDLEIDVVFNLVEGV